MLSYNELLKKYNKLLEENRFLKEELGKFQKSVVYTADIIKKPSISNNSAVFNKHSSPTDKVKLFMKLFCGRTDVFAKRWQSISTGKSGYQPVCGNEWDEKLCNKRKVKCSECPNRRLLSLTEKDIYNHLSGKDKYSRDVVGIYPLLKDETCNFLCVDFDDDEYISDVQAFLSVCDLKEIPAYIERSRSGNGAHIWIFFDNPVAASLARRLGTGILTSAMNERSEIKFNSYDRFLPNQDTLPSGGFGNLIALPLQGLARKNNNSVFVNKEFEPYDDQWNFLYNIKRLSSDQVEQLTNELCRHGEFGSLMTDSGEEPWKNKAKEKLSSFEFSCELKIIRSNMLYIPKKNLSSNAKNKIKRLAAFKNPEFYKAQAMRLPTYNKPRIICTADDTEHYISLPRGCEPALCALLDNNNISYEIDDKTNCGQKIDVSFNGTLRDEQIPAAQALLKHDNGVLSATTAFGKTVIAANIISERKINTLVLVHTKALLTQWQKSLEQFLNLNISAPEPTKGRKKKFSPIGTLSGDKNALNGIVDVAVMQSLITGDDVKELVRNYGMIIIDECHHVSAVNFEMILKYANAKYVYGLTATPTRQDGHHPIIFMQCGEIRYRVDAKSQAKSRAFQHYIIPRFTSCRADNSNNITKLYDELSKNEIRNNLIVNDVAKSLELKRNPIVLTERKEHAIHLAKLLSDKCKNIIILTGTSSAKQKREAEEKLATFPQNEPLIIVATGKYVGEGFDYPRLDTLFLALPISWKGKVAQYAGRLHRNYPGKSEVQIYDYADIHIPVFEKMYQKRVKAYSSIGYKIKFGENNASAGLIYDSKNFYSEYQKDIESARDEIIIASPYIRKDRVILVSLSLLKAKANGAKITVITRPPQEYKVNEQESVIQNKEFLEFDGIKVVYKPNFFQKFTVIDNKITWYGSVNVLGYLSIEDSIIRLIGSDIAEEITKLVEN